MEVLIKGEDARGTKIRPSYLSGASSGSISAVALNAILESVDKNSTLFSWEAYKKLIFGLTPGQVYDDSIEGLAKIFTYNIFEGYFLDNTPLRTMLSTLLQKVNYNTLGDLYLPTEISVFNQSSGETLRLWSTDPEVADLSLIEVMMASTAIPMAFSPSPISGLGHTMFIDGGTGVDTLPVYGLLENPHVTSIYVICYNSALLDGGDTLPPELDYIKLLKNGLATIDDMRVEFFVGGLEVAASSDVKSFTFIPSLNESFSSLDFSNEKLQYELARTWALQNTPTSLN